LDIKKIKFLGKEDNWWGPAGETGPCGPDTEMFVNDVEIWNDVFMEYNKTKDGKFIPLSQKNVDTGMGVERTLAILNGLKDNYETEIWKPIIEEILKLGHKKVYEKSDRHMRIIADHIKAAVFLISEGIVPSNTERGYVLRKLIRRAVRWGQRYTLKNFTDKVAEPVFKIYENSYPELKENRNKKFHQTNYRPSYKGGEGESDKVIELYTQFFLTECDLFAMRSGGKRFLGEFFQNRFYSHRRKFFVRHD